MAETRIYTNGWQDYELIDAGGGKKLERWGEVITIRPEVQAYFRSGKTFDEWKQLAHWEFMAKGAQSGNWKKLKDNAPEQWSINYGELTFQLQLTKFKHIGLFPEQRVNWDFIQSHLKEDSKFLNLFAYTGAASCVAKNCKAETIHVDSVKQLISWARTNMEMSKLKDIKWVHEDALKFVEREVKRNNHYDGIIMDPPAWGTGAKNEKWKLEDKLNDLMKSAAQLIGKDGFLILNTYSPTVEINTIRHIAKFHFTNRSFEVNELWMKTTTGKELYYGNLLRVWK